MGFGSVEDIAKRLLDEINNVVFIISCGNNNKLLETLNSSYNDNKRIIALPYTDELGKYMAISDIILSKPGGLTTTEIVTMRKPLIHIMPIPGCENYNANFFADRKMSLKCDNIDEIVKNTKRLLENQMLKKDMIQNQRKYISEKACEKIADFVIKQLDRGNCNE